MENLNELKNMNIEELIDYAYAEFGIEDIDLPELSINDNGIIDDGIQNRAKMIARIAEIDDELFSEMKLNGNPSPEDWEEVLFGWDADHVDYVIDRLYFYHKVDMEAFEGMLNFGPTKRMADSLGLH